MRTLNGCQQSPLHVDVPRRHTTRRECAYDRESTFGRLAKGLDEANERGWVLVDMKNDWSEVFPPAADADK